MPCSLDHFVVAAASLQEGAAWLEDKLGAPLSSGGQHIKMGTHNSLVRLDETTYIELIAVDKTLPAPGRRRWFGLDEAAIVSKIKQPTLLTWAVRTGDLNALVERAPIPMGKVEAMSRGTLNWLITIPGDGRLTEDGAFPFGIEWLGSQHPSHKLPLRGLSLQRFEIGIPDMKTFNAALDAINFEKGAYDFKVTETPQAFLTLRIKTGGKVVELSSVQLSPQVSAETGKTGGGEPAKS